MSVSAGRSQSVVVKHSKSPRVHTLDDGEHVFRWFCCLQTTIGQQYSQDGRPGLQFERPRLRCGAQMGQISSTRPIRVPHRQCSSANGPIVMFSWQSVVPQLAPTLGGGQIHLSNVNSHVLVAKSSQLMPPGLLTFGKSQRTHPRRSEEMPEIN
uniref:(northern house mosquito) hypothetical protein n=1 Tax=Culex pipiens TaxID=7175 RepID=A0A8D8BS31_CULPI